MDNEKSASELIDAIINTQDYLDSLFTQLRYCTDIDKEEYQENIKEVSNLLSCMKSFNLDENNNKNFKDANSRYDRVNSLEKHKSEPVEVPCNIIVIKDKKGNFIGSGNSMEVLPIEDFISNFPYDSFLKIRGVVFKDNYGIKDVATIIDCKGKFCVEYDTFGGELAIDGDTITCKADRFYTA